MTSGRTRFPTSFHVRGEEHGRAKLTWEQVQEIRKLYAEGKMSQRELAKKFGVSQTTIFRICHGKNWLRE